MLSCIAPHALTRRSSRAVADAGRAFIVEAVRTPVGRRNGVLSDVHPADLGAHVIRKVVRRAGVDPAAIDDVMFGCVDALGPQAGDIARTCALVAGLPEQVPGVTIDRQCGSSQQAIHFAAQAVMSGVNDLVIAGGVQNMSMIPLGYALTAASALDHGDPFSGSVGWRNRYGDQKVGQLRSAEMIAERWGIERREMERLAFASHRRAVRAQDEGRFDGEIAPLRGIDFDEGPRREISFRRMEALPALVDGGSVTAAAASQISDAACALLIANERALRAHDLKPRALIHHMSVRADDPIIMLTGPIAATRYALERAHMTVDDIDLFECNEAFAPVVLAWMRELHVPYYKVNVNGGAIALGHPLGASGARIMTTLLNDVRGRRSSQRHDH
jgi:acetyl-CoA C-acetyltransferase